MSSAAHDHRRAVLMMVLAATCWSSGGFLVRQVSIQNAWEIVYWRSLAMAIFVAITLAVMHRGATLRTIRAVGMPGVLSGCFLAGTFFFFIASLTRTTVANTFVLMSVSPFLAALAGRIFLGERVPPRTWVAMAVAFAGIVTIFGAAVDVGRLTGNLLALGVSFCFALNVTMLRRFHASVDMLPTVMLAGIFSLLPAFLIAGPLEATPRDIAVLAFMGCVQLGTGCLLMTAASRALTATELGLLALLEPILGPLWVWLLMAEAPSRYALIGGVIVLGAVLANEIYAAWESGRQKALRGVSMPEVLPPA
ncbi:MAG: DMT family transporter [Casimicrobiaceae bacterium]